MKRGCHAVCLALGALYWSLGMAGCGSSSPPPAAQPIKPKQQAARPEKRPAKAQPGQREVVTPPRERQRPPERTLADLAAQAEAQAEKPLDPMRSPLPGVDEAKCQARGIRKLTSEHLILYTDVASSPAVDELPHVFDLALPQWLTYFHIDAKRAEKWRMVGVIAEKKERFADTGLWPANLPPFLHVRCQMADGRWRVHSC